MNFKEILELIDKVADRGIGSVEVERAGIKVRIEGKKSDTFHVTQPFMEQRPMPAANAPALPAPHSAQQIPASAAAPEDEDASLHIITSPIVGTFYRTPNPESDPFVNVGDRISRGGVLCIIEAMKLLNEIESEVEGEIVKIFPQNAQPVEYGEKLFAVRI